MWYWFLRCIIQTTLAIPEWLCSPTSARLSNELEDRTKNTVFSLYITSFSVANSPQYMGNLISMYRSNITFWRYGLAVWAHQSIPSDKEYKNGPSFQLTFSRLSTLFKNPLFKSELEKEYLLFYLFPILILIASLDLKLLSSSSINFTPRLSHSPPCLSPLSTSSLLLVPQSAHSLGKYSIAFLNNHTRFKLQNLC